MLDHRFYSILSSPTVSQIGQLLGSESAYDNPDQQLTGFAPSTQASNGDLTFVSTRAAVDISSCKASACVTNEESARHAPDGLAIFLSRDPRASFALAAAQMAARKELDGGQGAIHPDAQVASTAVTEPGVVIGKGAAIGEYTRIGAGAVIGPGVQIGRDSHIGAHASIYCALIGDRVTVLPGAVIGENGFGLPASGEKLIAHFGRVIIQDNVSIGANSCVDRGMLGDTVIGERSHIDNLCHIGHNVQIGAHVVMAAYAGVSGSSVVEDNVMFGGRVGLSDHVTVGTGARIAAGAAVLEDVPAGETWAGYPAKPIRGWMRELAWLRRAAQKRPRGE